MTTIRRRNPRLQGLIGLGAAIAWFCEHGHEVSIPLNDSQPYDLVVDQPDGGLLKVQVKTTTCRSPSGRFVVRLETAGGNQSFHTRKRFDPTSCDLLCVLTDARELYVIPSTAFHARTTLTLTNDYDRYREVPERS
jgi:hypothetical protein